MNPDLTSSPARAVAELRRAALDHASRGWHVFPLRPGTKQPAVPTHAAHRCNRSDPACWYGHVGWELRATLDPVQINRWWHKHPYGIGIATGPSGLVVIDLDTAKTTDQPDGADTFAALAATAGTTVPATYTVETPSGGRHLYFTTPRTGPALRSTAGRLGSGIDTRANGGYVVAPPTVTPAGAYLVTDPAHPIPLPAWLADLLTDPPATPERKPASTPGPARRAEGSGSPAGLLDHYVTAALAAETYRVVSAQPGQRNHTLFTAAVALGQLVGAQILSHNKAAATLTRAAERHTAAGAFDDTQAQTTIASGLRRGTDEPRRLPPHIARIRDRLANPPAAS